MLMIGIFTVSLCAYVFCRFFLRTANTSLSIENQKTNNQIEETSQTIKSLEEDINQLEQKTRVIGILDGQVTDNEDNVIYYDNN